MEMVSKKGANGYG